MPLPIIHNEKELLARLAAEEAEAFTAIYQAYYAAVLLYAEKITGGDAFVAQDATADAFIALWQGKHSFEDIAHLLRFLRTVVHHKCIDRFRLAKKETALQQELLHLTEQQQEEIFMGEIFAEASLLTKIRAAVEELPPHIREVFKLAFYERLTNNEIALRLGIKDATVRRRKTEALHQLRKFKKSFLFSATLLLFLRL